MRALAKMLKNMGAKVRGSDRDSSIYTLQLDEQGITDHRRYQMVRNFLSFQARDKAIPISGSFELTPLCNLDCKMCYVHLQPNQIKQSERLLTVTEWKKIISEAVDAGFKAINMDLIAGLPGDTVESFSESVRQVIALDPSNITIHTLALKKGADLFERRENLPAQAEVEEMVAYANEKLRHFQCKPAL